MVAMNHIAPGPPVCEPLRRPRLAAAGFRGFRPVVPAFAVSFFRAVLPELPVVVRDVRVVRDVLVGFLAATKSHD